MATYKRGQETVVLGATKNNLNKRSERELVPRPTDLKSRALTTRPCCLPGKGIGFNCSHTVKVILFISCFKHSSHLFRNFTASKAEIYVCILYVCILMHTLCMHTQLSTMLRHVVLKCCDHLAGACKCWTSNVGICCADMLRSFGRSFKSR